MRNQFILITIVLLFTVMLWAGGEQETQSVEAKINWNAPQSMYDRTQGEQYILPEGWEKAVEGVDKLTIPNAGAMKSDPAMAKNLKAFEEMTGVKVEYWEISDPQLVIKQSGVLRAQSGELDLIYGTTLLWPLPQLVDQGWLAPIDELWNDEISETYGYGARDYLTSQDRFYVFPYVGPSYSQFIHYRTDLLAEAGFSEPPATWDELIEVADKLTVDTNNDGVVDRYGLSYGVTEAFPAACMFNSFLTAAGGELMDSSGKINVQTPEAEQAMQLLVDLRNKYRVVSEAVNAYTRTESIQLMASDKAAMVLAPSFASNLISKVPEIFENYEMALTPLPRVDMERKTNGGFAFYGVNPYSENIEVAKLLLDFLRSYQARKNEVLMEKNKVLNLNIWNASDIREQQKHADLLITELETWVVWPIEKAAYQEIIKEELGEALIESKTVKEALADAQSRINDVFGY